MEWWSVNSYCSVQILCVQKQNSNVETKFLSWKSQFLP